MPRTLTVVVVTAALCASPRAEARRKDGTVTVVSFTAGAEVLVDGTLAGTVPLEGPLTLPAGRHVLTVRKPGFGTYERPFDLGAGQSLELEADLFAVAGILRVASKPSDASVEVDGRAVCRTPCETQVSPGERTVVLTRDGFAPHRRTLGVVAGSTYALEIALEVAEPPALPPPPGSREVGSERRAMSVDPLALSASNETRRVVQQEWYETWWVWAAAASLVALVLGTTLVAAGNLGAESPAAAAPPQSPCEVWSLSGESTCAVP